jgi:hypothetical protein
VSDSPARAVRVVPPLLLVFAACALAEPASAAQVWTALATEKIRPVGATPRPLATASLSAARNEFESFQVLVSGAATNVRATATPLAGPATLPAPRLHRAAIMNLTYASALDGATGKWPDALVPDVDEIVGERRNAFPFSVPAGESHAIWVEVFVPPDAPAGAYAGSVHVTWDGGEATVPVALTVWPFTLPSTSSLRSTFKLSYGTLTSGSAHGSLALASLATLRARYGALGLDHRISLAYHDDGSNDLAHFDRYYGPLLDGAAPTQLAGAELTALQFAGSGTNTSAMTTWTTHTKARGWFDRLFQYTCDEPPLTCAWTDIPVRAAAAKSVDPAFRTLVTTSIQDADARGVTSSIDLLVPVINYLHDKPGYKHAGNQRAKYDAFLAGSPLREVWAYQSCMSHGCGGYVNFENPGASDSYYAGWPSYMIDASAVQNRAMQWLAFSYDLTGELYYEVTMAYGRNDPWTSQWEFSGNGDGTLFYPGTPAKIGGATHVPVASIRLKMIREGMEDYEYLRLLSDAGDEGLAREIARTVFPNPYTTSVSPSALMAARERLARRIVELTAPPPPPPPQAPPADPPSEPPADPPAEDPPAEDPPGDPGDPGDPDDPGTPGEGGPDAPEGDGLKRVKSRLPVVRGGCGTDHAAGLLALVGVVAATRLRRRRR